MKRAGNVALCGERKGACRVLMGKLRERKYLKDLSVVGRIILKCIFKKWDRVIGCIYLALNRDR